MLPDHQMQPRTSAVFRLFRAGVSLLVLIAQLMAVESTCCAADPVPFQTRRTFVPGRHPERWPAGDWVPVRPKRLESLLKAAGSVSAESDRFEFTSATYEATFNPKTRSLESGRATLVRRDTAAGLTEFEPCSLAISGPVWAGTGNAGSDVRLGVLGTDPQGLIKLVSPEGSQELQFDWSLRGRRRLTGIDFDIEVPGAVVTGFQLHVPEGWQVTADAGVAYRRVDNDSGETPHADKASLTTTWCVDIGHASRCRIRLREPSSSELRQQVDAASYRLSSRSLLRSEWFEQVFEFTFDTMTPGADELTMSIPPELIVSSIEDGSGRAFSWRDTGPQADKWHALRIQLGGDIENDSRRIVVRGSQAVTLRSEQLRIRLESPRPDNAVLLGGNVSPVNIAVETPFQIARYSAQGMRQTATSVDLDRHELAFDQYSSRAYVDLHIHNFDRQALRKLSVREYSVLDVSTIPQQLDVVLELTSQSQGVFASSWLVPLEWELTAVSSSASSATATSEAETLSWSVSRVSDRYQRLVIDLADGLAVRKPMRLRVTAQRADQSSESEIAVPTILPEIARSVSIVFGVTGCDDPHQVQISSEVYHRHSDAETLLEADWTEMVADSERSLQAVWTANYWTLAEGVQSATLLMPDGALTSVERSAAAADGTSIEDDPPSIDVPSAIAGETVNDASTEGIAAKESKSEENAKEEPQATELIQPTIVSTEFESRLSPGTVSRDLHRFTWKFHYPSQSLPFQFRLPLKSELLAVSWRGQKIAPIEEGDSWLVPLASVEAGDELSVDYTLPSQDVYLRETYRCRVPVADVTVVQFHWMVRLRSRYSIVSFAADLTPDEAEHAGFWLSWCFGPLARSSDSSVFNPFRSDSWTSLLRGRVDRRESHPGTYQPGWKTFLASSSGPPESLTVHVCDQSRLRALSWFVLMISGLIGVLLRSVAVPHRSRFALVWLSGCAASVAMVPGAYAELVGAAVLGSILATLVPRSLVRPFRQSSTEPPQVGMASTITRRVISGAVVLVAISFGVSGWAQSSEAGPESLIDVLVPYTDSAFQEEADPEFVFIQNQDLQSLIRTSLDQQEPSPQMLLSTSHWQVKVTESGRAEVEATIGVAVHDKEAHEIEIPIAARFLAGQSVCTVNGIPVSVLPSADGSRLRISLPQDPDGVFSADSQTGPVPPPLPEPVEFWRKYVVQLQLRPLTQRSRELATIVLPVPVVPDARVALSFDQKPESVFAGDRSDPVLAGPENTATLVLGPAEELVVSWRASTPGPQSVVRDESTLPVIEVRSAIDIHPNWLERRTFARYQVSDRPVRYIEWKLPVYSKVDLEQFRIRNLVDRSIRRVGDSNLLACEFDPPMTESFDFEIRWRQLLPDRNVASGISWATALLPGEENVPLKVIDHLAGLSPEAGFQLTSELQELAAASNVDSSMFIGIWPENDRPRIPELVFRVSETTTLVPGITPLESQRTTRLSQVGMVEPFGVRWTISAEVDTAVVAAFAHEFQLNEEFRIDTVSVLEDDVDRLSHWEHENGRLFLHLRNRRSGVQNITITGQQKIRPDGTVVVPRLQPGVGPKVESTLLLYRSPKLQVGVEGAQPVKEDSSDTVDGPAIERFMGRFRTLPGQIARLRIDSVPVDPSAWIVADVLPVESGEVSVSMVIHLHAMPERNVLIGLPDWVSREKAIDTSVIGLAGASASVSADKKMLNVILPRPVPQEVDVSLNVSMNLEDETSYRFAPPVVRGIVRQNAVLAFSDEIDEWEALPIEPLNDTLRNQFVELQQQADGTVDRLTVWTDATRVSRPASLTFVENLPPLVLHVVRPGIRRNGVSTTRLLLRTDLAQLSLDWPRDAQVISVRIDGRVENILPPVGGVLKLPVTGHNSVHDVEVLWRLTSDAETMKIQRRTIPLPRLRDMDSAQAFVIASPSRRVSLISTDAARQPTVRSAVRLSKKWGDSLERGPSADSAIEAASWFQTMLTSAASASTPSMDLFSLVGLHKEPAEVQSDSIADSPSDDISTGWPDGESRVLVQGVDEAQIRLWVVDNRVDGVLASILIGIVVLPVFLVFLKMETGDRIARHPGLCWLVLGLIWWLCLKGSGAGFVLGAFSALSIVVAYLAANRVTAVSTGHSQG